MRIIRFLFKSFIIFFISILIIATLIGHTSFGNTYVSQSRTKIYTTIDDDRIRIKQKGIGKDILLIHGTPGSVDDWDYIFDDLAQDYRVTAFDRLGHGYSTHENYTYHLKENAALVSNLISSLELNNPLLVGHSYGGSTLAQYAVDFPSKTDTMIILDSKFYGYKPRFTAKLIGIPILGKGIAFLANYTIAKSTIDKGVRQAFSNQSESSLKSLIQQRLDIWLQPKILISNAYECLNYTSDLESIAPKFNQIKANITVITGTDTIKTSVHQCEKFTENVLGSKLIKLDKTGHYIQIDQPKKVIDIIRETYPK